jgi:hypothetical protein
MKKKLIKKKYFHYTLWYFFRIEKLVKNDFLKKNIRGL